MTGPSKTLSPIFPDSASLGIHLKYDYGSKITPKGDTRKYQVYTSQNGSSFDVAAPIACSVLTIDLDPMAHRTSSWMKKNISIVFSIDSPPFKRGDSIEIFNIDVDPSIKVGQDITAGTKLGTTRSKDGAIVDLWNMGGSTHHNPDTYIKAAQGTDPANSLTGTTGTTTSTAQGADVGSIAKAAAFSTFFQMPGIFDTIESNLLTGQKSLMNDQPLMPFIQQLTAGCLRRFMSTPSGDFFAFYPDYFGGLGKTAYWYIDDIEVIDGSIELSDDNLATHVYVVGDVAGPPAQVDQSSQQKLLDELASGGVVTVFNAFMADFLNGTDSPSGHNNAGKATLANKADALAFLKKYGARPYYHEAPTVRAPIYEAFLAYQTFCLKWSEQFKTTFQFTFMPELFPGGIVAFPEHGLQCFVESVTHDCSYETGFTTTAELSAPSAFKSADGAVMDPDKAWVHAGMIRAWPDTGAVGQFKDATDTDPSKLPTPHKKGK